MPQGQDGADVYLAYVRSLRQQGKMEESVAALKQGLARISEMGIANVYVEYGHVLLGQGKPQEAINILE